MKILITGSAGFIGFSLAKKILKNKNNIVYGIDNLSGDKKLKILRNNILKKNQNYFFKKIDITNKKKILSLKKYNIEYILHLAASAGVRNSLNNPNVYFENNLNGFFNILELSKISNIKHLVFASSSSVYGSQKNFPIKENFNTDNPNSFYAATKKSNELLASSYSQMYNLNITGLRYFSVYGPYGRPDMAVFIFVKKIMNNETVYLHNYGNDMRDMTYIDDVVNLTLRILNKKRVNTIPFNIFNIGFGKSIKILNLFKIIKNNLNVDAKYKLIKAQIGDVPKTYSSSNKILKYTKYKMNYRIEDGVDKFIKWYKEFYNE